MPNKHIKIISLQPTSINIKVSFKSLDEPESISLHSSVMQDRLVVDIPKKMIINGQEGDSLVLDSSDFEEEDGKSFFMSATLEPQKINPKTSTTKGVQGAVDTAPSVTAGSTGVGMTVSLLGGNGPEDLADSNNEEQQSASNSAAKT